MRCSFCFATYDSVMQRGSEDGLKGPAAVQVLNQLREAGFEKITFAGGEPLLYPELDELLQQARGLGFVVSLVTNGFLLDSSRARDVAPLLDWLVLSIDSINDLTNRQIGRWVPRGGGTPLSGFLTASEIARDLGTRVKVNTVVTRFNSGEHLRPFVDQIGATRWKVMRVLPIDGENDVGYRRTSVSQADFWAFVELNSSGRADLHVVPEDHADMYESYVMVDPLGRFLSNHNGRYSVSAAILEVGVEEAVKSVVVDYGNFVGRGGHYDW